MNNAILDLGEKLSGEIERLKEELQSNAQEINNLRNTMFRAAAALRILNNVELMPALEIRRQCDEIVDILELPRTNCDGRNCSYAVHCEMRIDEQQGVIDELSVQLQDYNFAMQTLANQMGVLSDSSTDLNCCPRVIPNIIE